MNFNAPKNENYAAVVYEIKNLLPLEGCDNVVGTTIYGFQAIVGKDTKIGQIGIFFPAESQLSDEYCTANNLYRHSELNSNIEKKGYIEDNRRVKAMKFRGHASSALFLPLSSLSYLGIKENDLSVGDTFDELNGHEICRKYFVLHKNNGRVNAQPKAKIFTRVDTTFIPEHFSTDNYWRNAHIVSPETEVIVTQKVHGTSIRIANTKVHRRLTLRDRIAKFLGAHISDWEYDYVFGSRKVIKDIYAKEYQHYYDEDIWAVEGKKLEGLVPENFIIYGELVGWVSSGAPIQTGYTYHLPQGTCALYIYRVAFVNEKGFVVDLSWDQLKEFCTQRGLLYVPEIWRGKHKELVIDTYLDTVYKEKFPSSDCIALSDKGTVDEGVCIRVDKMTPYILKAKSPLFFEWETKLLDKGTEDIETAESLPDNEV